MAIKASDVEKAIAYLWEVAKGRGQHIRGGGLGKGYVSYTEFCNDFRLGPAHNNGVLNEFLRRVVVRCRELKIPDFASLVLYEDGSEPGKGWYVAHDYYVGDTVRWKLHRDECWAKALGLALSEGGTVFDPIQTDPAQVSGTFILQASYAGPKAQKYRGRLLDCIRSFTLLAHKEASGMSVAVWKLGQSGGFDAFPAPPGRDGQWVVEAFRREEAGKAEELGPVDPR
jgi:hypothetical protein